MSTVKNYLPDLTAEQMEIIIGSLLGDGRIDNNSNGRFIKSQAGFREEYLKWHFDKLSPYSNGISIEKVPKITNNKDGDIIQIKDEFTTRCNYYTCNHPIFKTLRQKWYPNNKKQIPADLKLTPLIIAIWFCDDGSNDSSHREAKFSTESFTINEIQLLINLLLEFDIFCYSVKARNNKRIIKISNYSYLDFIKLISPYVIFDCMKYKVDLSNFIPSKNFSIHEVRSIKNDLKEGIGINFLSNKYNVSPTTIYDIKKERTWKWLT